MLKSASQIVEETISDYNHNLKKLLRKSKIVNLDSFGKNESKNILYIAGFSGSGKSTVADSIARPNDNVIHLDSYSEFNSPEMKSLRNKKFNKFLDKNNPGWKNDLSAYDPGSKKYWSSVDNFRRSIEDFGNREFRKGNRVIVEGVQIADDWLAEEDKMYYKDKPVVILGTNPYVSAYRAMKRDGRTVKNLDSLKKVITSYSTANKKLNDLFDIIKT